MKAKTIFYCTECGNETPKWQGRCPACGAWNTMVERPAEKAPKKSPSAGRGSALGVALNRPKTMAEVETTDELRFPTGMGELDRVLGGGAVRGSLVLVGGAPGIGKSTLMLQICDHLCRTAKVLYVSGEESERQIKLRAERLQVRGEGLSLLSETNLENVIDAVHAVSPDVLIVDSIQTLYHGDVTAAPGSISQVKECTMALMQLAKGEGLTIFVIGHVNKEGSIAGPKVLEHMVDCVLYFEGERHMAYRILRAAKNRFGATNEIGVFEMEDGGLAEVPNPSEAMLAGRPENAPGTCVACVMEGVRPPALRCARVPLCRRAPPCRAGRARPALRRKETKRARPFVQAAARLHKSPVLYRCRPFWGRRAEAAAPLVGRVRRGQLPTRCGGERDCGGPAPAAPALAAWQRGPAVLAPSGDSVCSAPAPSRARAAPRVSICSTGAPVSAIPPAPLDSTAARCQKSKSLSSDPMTMQDGSCV